MSTAIAEASRTARVLVFGVDDGCFCVHLDWVEAVYQRDEAVLHTAKAGESTRPFLLHRGQPALVVDLREAFGLTELLGVTERAAFMIVRAGSFLLALPVDGCSGVRELDLRTKAPVATNLVHDGGLSVGHLVDIEGRLHALLEPNRILSGALREKLEPLLKEALAFRDRQDKIAAVAVELRRAPTAAALKTFGRLVRRNGRPRAANAAKALLKALQESESATGLDLVAGDLGGDTLMRDLIALSTARRTGELAVETPDGAPAKVFLDAGRVADACAAGIWGRGAFKRILSTREGNYRFVAAESPVQPQRINESAVWLLVETSEQLGEERRGRHAR